MSSGQICIIRDLGPVKGGKGLRHHEVILTVSWFGIMQFAKNIFWRRANRVRDLSQPEEHALASREGNVAR
ncbi:hypothetical protein ACVINW_003950 [Bradyrhizobium sp. USDA 4461]